MSYPLDKCTKRANKPLILSSTINTNLKEERNLSSFPFFLQCWILNSGALCLLLKCSTTELQPQKNKQTKSQILASMSRRQGLELRPEKWETTGGTISRPTTVLTLSAQARVEGHHGRFPHPLQKIARTKHTGKWENKEGSGRNNSLVKQSAPLPAESIFHGGSETPAPRNFPQAFPSVLVMTASRNGPRRILLLRFRCCFFLFSCLLPHYFDFFLRYKLFFSFVIHLFVSLFV